MLDTTDWAQFPFSVDGVQFVSKIDKNGSFYPKLSSMPIQMVNLMNESAVRELIGKASLLSTAEIETELARVNEGASQALICLA